VQLHASHCCGVLEKQRAGEVFAELGGGCSSAHRRRGEVIRFTLIHVHTDIVAAQSFQEIVKRLQGGREKVRR
jgi:hypothetical protein